MPHKFNADRRDKIPKQKQRVTNWSEYNECLRRRGDLTVWISEDALALWAAPRRTTPGGQPYYSDLAIELCLTLGMVFKQPLRQTQGLMRSIATLLGVEIAVPDSSTLEVVLVFRPAFCRNKLSHWFHVRRQLSGSSLEYHRPLPGSAGHAISAGVFRCSS